MCPKCKPSPHAKIDAHGVQMVIPLQGTRLCVAVNEVDPGIEVVSLSVFHRLRHQIKL